MFVVVKCHGGGAVWADDVKPYWDEGGCLCLSQDMRLCVYVTKAFMGVTRSSLMGSLQVRPLA